MLILASSSVQTSRQISKRRKGDHHTDEDEGNAVVNPISSPLPPSVATSTATVTSVETISSSSQSTSSSEQPAPSTTASPAPATLHFINLTNATTCGDYTFSWNSTFNNSVPISLFINEGNEMGYIEGTSFTVTATASPSTSSALRMIATNISSDAQQYTWGMVDVMEGWYIVNAAETTTAALLGMPAPFYVQNGTDLECIQSGTPQTPTNPSSPNLDRHLAMGDLVGIVFGAVAGVACLTVAFLFPRLWRRALPSPKTKRPYLLY